MADCTSTFVNYLVDQTPHFDADIVRDINPQSGTWIGKVETKTWPSFMGNTHSFDRFTNVFANPTRDWTPKEYKDCEGNPCDPTADQICWGNVRQIYFKEVRSIETQLLCFDQIRDVSHAKEHSAHIVSEILRPATTTIMDYYLKKRAAEHAGKKWVANSTMDDFIYKWTVFADNEIYMDANVLPTDVYKLAPQMLQRRVTPLTLKGYMNTKVFEGFPNLIELITDVETTWDLDKQVNSAVGAGALAAFWRFQDWATGNAYWKYGFSGQLGNYTVSVDPFALRFNYKGASLDATYPYRYQVVLPYTNTDAGTAVYEGASFESGTGLRMIPNEDYDTAQFQFHYLHHRMAGSVYTAVAEQINPNMPFSPRSLAGQWKFANKELGCENIRGNKGKFFADFELAWKPEHPEWEELIFAKREPACVPEVETCNDDPGYPTQTYNSACDLCEQGPFTTDEACTERDGVYLAANTVTVAGFPIVHPQIPAADEECADDYEALATLMNADAVLSLLGTWDVDTDGDLILTNPTVNDVDVTIECCDDPQ
jgi:hypothetical protein